MKPISDPGLAAALAIFPSRQELAGALGVTPQALAQWSKVPSHRVIDVERVTGVDRHVLRPDLYPPPRAEALGAA